MTSNLQPGYRFVSQAQWDLCRFVSADRTTAQAKVGLRPFAPYGLPAASLWIGAAFAPAISGEAELLWRDGDGHLRRLPYASEQPESLEAPAAIRSATRMVASGGTIWTAGHNDALQAFDDQSLTRLFELKVDSGPIVDCASDSYDGVFVLARAPNGSRIAHVNCAGSIETSFLLDCTQASEIAYLGKTETIVLLSADKSRIHFVSAKDGQLVRTILISEYRLCFTPSVIASDGCARLFIAGSDGQPIGGRHQILLLDGDASLLGVAPSNLRVTGMAATPSSLFASTDGEVVRFSPSAVVPDGWGELRATSLTPLLKSPSKQEQKWLRAEARVTLRDGCSIEISYATPKHGEDAASIDLILRDTSLSETRRIEAWREKVDVRTYAFQGSSSSPSSNGEVVLSAPLHDVASPVVWIEVAVAAAPAAALPELSELSVFYPGPTLISDLPAIYRRRELGTGDYLRALVGVLEAGTQQLDGRIGELGRNIDPKTAGDDWLDYVASWLGLPWDNGLSTDQKRKLVGSAAEIAAGHGTRRGLEVMLRALVPESRFRIVDTNVDHGLAVVAGDGCLGARLPAMIAGLPASSSVLGTRATLGQARLPCAEIEGETARLLGQVRVEIAATVEEQGAWEPWLQKLIDQMMPAAARAQLRWIPPYAFELGRIGPNSKLEADPEAHLGTDAVTGAARVGGRARTTLPARLTRDWTLQ